MDIKEYEELFGKHELMMTDEEKRELEIQKKIKYLKDCEKKKYWLHCGSCQLDSES